MRDAHRMAARLSRALDGSAPAPPSVDVRRRRGLWRGMRKETPPQSPTPPRWKFWIDRGGTFTDCLGLCPHTGRVHVEKVLSSDRAPLQGIRQILGLGESAPIPASDIRMGTTVATNALLERKGEPSALAITRGFGDALQIGNQRRPNIFQLDIVKPQVLYSQVLEVDARAAPSGEILTRPDPDTVLRELEAIRKKGIESIAVVVLHAYRAGELEDELSELSKRAGFSHIALSHEIAGELGLVARGDTTTLDAYLTPLISAYVSTLRAELPGSTLELMQSSGALTSAEHFRGPNAILSGPAGGVVAYARIAEDLGLASAIGFDMGGTSTDVSRFDGTFARVYESETAGVRVRAPMMDIHTVAAGGGSLCRFDGHKLIVGPQSAGATPGPLAYGRNDATEPALTDVNLVLGRLVSDRFPFPLAVDRARTALDALAKRAGGDATAESLAAGFFRVANHTMAEAIRRVSVARGFDVRGDALIVFGGAGGQHACALAELLEMDTVVFHPYAGVLSAFGMGLADVGRHAELDAGRVELSATSLKSIAPRVTTLAEPVLTALEADGFQTASIKTRVFLDARYRGTDAALTLPWCQLEDLKTSSRATELQQSFHATHRRLFGYARPAHTIELTTARVEATAESRKRALSVTPGAAPRNPQVGGSEAAAPVRTGSLHTGGRRRDDVPVYHRESLVEGQQIEGPALILEQTGTIVVDPPFCLHADRSEVLTARRTATRHVRVSTQSTSRTERPDPVLLEIMGNLYMSIAEQMGHVLRRTALSTNIRERLDFSCAVFDETGSLVANAPHIPVHLGAMGESVRGVVEAHPSMEVGDVYVTNDPAKGGSHLPDVTVVTPVHDDSGALRYFTASRGHHADIGGITPGSMPPFSSSLSEEGVLLRALRIVHQGRFDEALVHRTLIEGPYPARNPADNIADLSAQIAANQKGVELLRELIHKYGDSTVQAYMRHVQDNAAACVAREISRIADGERSFKDALDDGSPIQVALTVRGDRMSIDFTGTGPEVSGNLNAPHAVTVSAVLYVLRTMVGAPIPLNAGCLRPVTLHVPKGSLLNPGPTRAVAGGNVETSQRVVDVLLGALGIAAASQGTMNNLTFGTEDFGYYETIAGGAGAGKNFSGASAVHTHMTNTAITDPEVLESRYPVLLRQFSVRKESGGEGAHAGGDGVLRELEFLEPMRVSLLSERRVLAPFGLFGGASGKRGRNSLCGAEVPGKAVLDVQKGDVLSIQTPGGGGFGTTKS